MSGKESRTATFKYMELKPLLIHAGAALWISPAVLATAECSGICILFVSRCGLAHDLEKPNPYIGGELRPVGTGTHSSWGLREQMTGCASRLQRG